MCCFKKDYVFDCKIHIVSIFFLFFFEFDLSIGDFFNVAGVLVQLEKKEEPHCIFEMDCCISLKKMLHRFCTEQY